MQPGLSILLVNYNATALLLQCLRSFVPHLGLAASEVIVIDNASKQSPQAQLNAAFPAVRFVQTGYNAGFARANNAGIAHARYNTVLLLNVDTIVQGDAILQAYHQLSNSPYVAAGVQLLNADGSAQMSGSRVMKGGLNYLLPLPYLGQLLGWLAKKAQVQKPGVEQAEAIEEVDWINGAFLMVKKDAIEKAGLLDEAFFLYMEEIEWCGRLRKQGRLALFGNLHVVHLQGETTADFFKTKKKGYQNLSDTMGRQLMLSIWVRQRKQFGAGWFLLLVMMYGLEVPLFFLVFPVARLAGSTRYTLADATGYAGNYCTNLRYFFSILGNRPCFYKVI